MNGPNDNNGTPVPQQSLMVPFSTVTTAPEVSASVSASSSQVVWSQHQSTVPTPSGPRPILAPSQAPSSVSSPLVFTSSATTFNGPVISPTTSTDVPSSTQTNGVVMTTDSAPKNSSISSTTPSEQSLSLSSGTLPVIQSVTSVPVPTDSVQQKLTAVFNSKSLLELVKETDTYLQLDDEAEEAFTLLSEEFIENVAKQAIRMAKHRGSPVVEARDVRFCVERDWNIQIPGYSSNERHFKRPFILQSHKQRMALIRKHIKRS